MKLHGSSLLVQGWTVSFIEMCSSMQDASGGVLVFYVLFFSIHFLTPAFQGGTRLQKSVAKPRSKAGRQVLLPLALAPQPGYLEGSGTRQQCQTLTC